MGDPNAQYIWWMILCLASVSVMFVHHAFKLWQMNTFVKQKWKSAILPLMLIFFAIAGITVFIVTVNIIPDHSFCIFAAHWGTTGYSIFKFIKYSILIQRFYRIFNDTALAYDERKLKIWIGILAVWTFSNLIGINMTAENIAGTCEVTKPPLPMIASIALLDTVSCVTNTILFAKPLFKMNQLTKDNELKFLALKQSILSIIAVISTMLSLLVVAMVNLYVISISFDYVCSSLCIILMFEWNAVFIQYICGICKLKCIINKLKQSTNDENTKRSMSSIKSNSTQIQTENTPATSLPRRSYAMQKSDDIIDDIICTTNISKVPQAGLRNLPSISDYTETADNATNLSNKPYLMTIHDSEIEQTSPM